jgi:hypothetical protein
MTEAPPNSNAFHQITKPHIRGDISLETVHYAFTLFLRSKLPINQSRSLLRFSEATTWLTLRFEVYVLHRSHFRFTSVTSSWARLYVRTEWRPSARRLEIRWNSPSQILVTEAWGALLDNCPNIWSNVLQETAVLRHFNFGLTFRRYRLPWSYSPMNTCADHTASLNVSKVSQLNININCTL